MTGEYGNFWGGLLFLALALALLLEGALLSRQLAAHPGSPDERDPNWPPGIVSGPGRPTAAWPEERLMP
jgi:hypothetical protein